MRGIAAWTLDILAKARDTYGVNPAVFLALFLGSGPVFYYSLFRLLRAVARRAGGEAGFWGAVFLAATAAPYLYVLVFGRNLPVWVYIVVALLAAQGAATLVRKWMKARRSTPNEREKT